MQVKPYKATFLERIIKRVIQFFYKYYECPRYFVLIDCKITVHRSGESFKSKIVNISKTGVFFETPQKFDSGIPVNVEFEYDGEYFLLTARLISNHTIIDSHGAGAQFLIDRFHRNQRQVIDKLIEKIETNNPDIPLSE